MPATLRPSNFAIADRLRFLALAMLPVMLLTWAASFYPFNDCLDRQGTPLGADFTMFYTAGKVVSSDSAAKLYDQAEQQRQLHSLFPGLRADFCLPYRYPPFVASALSPLSALPYWLAFLLFFGVSLSIWILALRSLRRHTPSRGATGPRGRCRSATREVFQHAKPHSNSLWLSLAAWPVALETFIGGQASMFGVGILTAHLALLRRNHHVAAGAVLALAAYKPNVLALFAIGIVCRYPRTLLGLVPAGLLIIGATWWAHGESVCSEYVALLTRLNGNEWDVATPLWKIQGLEPWIALLAAGKSRLLTVVLGALLSAGIGMIWRVRKGPESITFTEFVPALLVINSLFNPYTPIYDLALLAPAIVLGAQRLLSAEARIPFSNGALQITAFTLFFGPHFSQALAKMIGVQLFPIALLAIALSFKDPPRLPWRVFRLFGHVDVSRME